MRKPCRIIGWTFLTILGVYLPVYMAQYYENGIYLMGQMNRIMASHYTQMITFAYNTASLATVLIGYLMIKKLWQIVNEKSGIDHFIAKYPEAKTYLIHSKNTKKKDINIKTQKSN